MRIFYLCLLVLVVTAGVATEASVNCAICGKAIDDRYVKFDDGSVFCLDCMENCPHCAICGKPSRDILQIDGRNICRACLPQLNRCSFCSEPLAGDYVTYPDLNLKLCEKCNRTVPRCDLCGRPELNLIRVGDNRICKTCYDLSDFCRICGNPIRGQYMWFEGDSTRMYCPDCVARYPRCASCGAPSGRRSKTLEDGRILCRACYNEGYFDPAQVKYVKEKVLEFMEKHLNMNIQHKIKYILQGQDYIKAKSDGASGDLNGLFHRHRDIYEIYVLYGLRDKDLYQVIPHEIAHAWAAENCRENLMLEEAEGFAQWVAYHTLRHFGFTEFSDTLLKGDNEYARGLRMMLEIERKSGRQAVFKRLLK